MKTLSAPSANPMADLFAAPFLADLGAGALVYFGAVLALAWAARALARTF